MRKVRLVPFLLALLLLCSGVARAEYRIVDDIGGRIGPYVDKYKEWQQSSGRVVIDGPCISACTLVLGFVPRHRICVTGKAALGFHAAWMPGPNGKPVPSEVGTRALWDMYPSHVRQWISGRGGLTRKMLILHGKELHAMYPRCGNTPDGWYYARGR